MTKGMTQFIFKLEFLMGLAQFPKTYIDMQTISKNLQPPTNIPIRIIKGRTCNGQSAKWRKILLQSY